MTSIIPQVEATKPKDVLMTEEENDAILEMLKRHDNTLECMKQNDMTVSELGLTSFYTEAPSASKNLATEISPTDLERQKNGEVVV